MKVLFINPSWDRYLSSKGQRINRAWPPLDLLNCAAQVERLGVEAALLDARAQPVTVEEIDRRGRDYDLIFITSSPLDRWQCPNLEIDLFLETVKKIRHPRKFVMGVHGTQFPEYVLDRSEAHAVFIGEPESIVAAIVSGRPLASIAGLCFREAGALVKTPAAPLEDLKTFPLPAFHLLEWGHYFYELMGHRFAILETTRGCPFPCTFCQRDLYGGKSYRLKTPPQVAAEVESALNLGATCGYFIDLEFSLNTAYSLEICKALQPFRSRWRWCVQTRANSVTQELLRAMKDAGCSLIHIGVETGSASLLKQVDKRITHEQIRDGVKMMRAAGIEVSCFFMYGLPGETDQDRMQTQKFAQELNASYASFHLATPYPGTPLYALKQSDSLYPESFFQGKEFLRLQSWGKAAYREYYLRPRYVYSRLREMKFQELWRQFQLLCRMMGIV